MAHGGVCTQVHSIYMAKILGKTFIKTRRLLMTRFSIFQSGFQNKTSKIVSKPEIIGQNGS